MSVAEASAAWWPSRFGEDDQLGMLNTVTPSMRQAVMEAADTRDMFDLAVDFFIGMPAYTARGSPRKRRCGRHHTVSRRGFPPQDCYSKNRERQCGGGLAAIQGSCQAAPAMAVRLHADPIPVRFKRHQQS